MRIVSLLPGATELACALGLRDRLVGVSHECDFPPEVASLPRLTATPIDPALPSGAIDAAVRAARDAGQPVIAVDAAALTALHPDLIVTQSLCEVCAVADGQVMRLAAALTPAPTVLALDGRTVTGILDDVRALASAAGVPARAAGVVAALHGRLERLALGGPRPRPRVLCLEWIDPPYTAGHWVPELVHAAGGADVGAAPGEHSRQRTWAELAAMKPDLIVVMLCGFGVERSIRELDRLANPEARALLASAPVWVIDANNYTSRPGPRLADGAERLRAALLGHPMEGLARWG